MYNGKFYAEIITNYLAITFYNDNIFIFKCNNEPFQNELRNIKKLLLVLGNFVSRGRECNEKFRLDGKSGIRKLWKILHTYMLLLGHRIAPKITQIYCTVHNYIFFNLALVCNAHNYCHYI